MKLYLLIILTTPLLIHPFSYDSAIYAAQKGDMQRADEQLKKIVVNAPDKADVLYDSGVITHGLKNTNQAAAYFARAAECAQGDKDLCVRAHFNAGNTCVDSKDLKCALDHYDKALTLEPDNEYVRHNRDRVAQMLQEQEQQKDQQQDKDEKDDQEKDQDDEKDDNKDQQQNDQQDGNDQSDGEQDQQKQDGNDQQQGGNGKQKNSSSDKNSDQQSDQQSQEEQGDDPKAGDKDTQREKNGNKEKSGSKSADQKKRDSKDDLEKGSQDAKAEGDKKQGQDHGKTPEQENKNQDKKSIAAGANGEQGKAEQEEVPKSFGKKIDDPWLASILDDQELRDKAINKQLMEAKIRQNGGKHGQNCW